jgi:hypothetical protein
LSARLDVVDFDIDPRRRKDEAVEAYQGYAIGGGLEARCT